MKTIVTEVMDREAKRDRQGRRITPAARRAECVAGYRASGLTMERYAGQEGIKRSTLAKWVYLHDRGGIEPKTVRFAEVKMAPSAGRWAFELALPNGWVVRAADAAALAQLMNLAGR